MDLILLVMTQRGLEGLLSEKFTLGGDIALVAGPVGRHAEAAVDVFMQGEIPESGKQFIKIFNHLAPYKKGK